MKKADDLKNGQAILIENTVWRKIDSHLELVGSVKDEEVYLSLQIEEMSLEKVTGEPVDLVQIIYRPNKGMSLKSPRLILIRHSDLF